MAAIQGKQGHTTKYRSDLFTSHALPTLNSESQGRLSFADELVSAAGCRNATRDRSRDHSLTATDGASRSKPERTIRASVSLDLIRTSSSRIIRRFEATRHRRMSRPASTPETSRSTALRDGNLVLLTRNSLACSVCRLLQTCLPSLRRCYMSMYNTGRV